MSTSHLLSHIADILARLTAELRAPNRHNQPCKARTTIRQEMHVLKCLSWAVAHEPALCFSPDFRTLGQAIWFRETDLHCMARVTRIWHMKAFRMMDSRKRTHTDWTLLDTAIRHVG